jgi:quinol monooxygenase YgiN
MSVYITAIIRSKVEEIARVKELLLHMVAQSRRETACLQYDLHQVSGDPGLFIFHEVWQSEEGIALHGEQAHIQEFIKVAPGLLQEPMIVHRTALL